MSPDGPATLGDEDDDFDDLPETHLDDDAYDEFLAREFDAEGRVRGDPPVTRFLIMLIVVLAIVVVLLFW
jgi:hypothetical protein